MPIPSQPPATYIAQCIFAIFNGSGSSPHRGRGKRGGWRGHSHNNYNQYNGSLIVATMRVSLGRTTIVMVAIGNDTSQQGRTSGHDILDANFAARLGTLHSNVHSLCIMVIKLRPTFSLVMLQQ